MSSRNTNLLKTLLLAPLLASARPSHPSAGSNSDGPSKGKRLATPEQITPYPIVWSYPSMPPQYHTPTDPRNEDTRWGNPVELQQPDHTRGSKADPADRPTQRPDDGRDWWENKDANRSSSHNWPTSVARLSGREARSGNDYRAVAKLPNPVVHSGVPDFAWPVPDDDVAMHVALPESVIADNYDRIGIQAQGAVQTDESTPTSHVIASSALPEEFNRDRLGATGSPMINIDVQVHPRPGPQTTDDDLNTLAGTSDHIPDAISGVIKVVSSVPYGKPAQEIACFPFPYSIDTINQIHERLIPGSLQRRADEYVQAPLAGVIGEPSRPIASSIQNGQVQANAVQLIPHLRDKLIQLNDSQIQTSQMSADNSVMEIDRLQNAHQVYGRWILDVQLQDPGAPVICDTPPSSASQPPSRQVGNRFSPSQDDDSTLETDSVHLGEQLHGGSGIVAIEIARERFGLMVDQIPDRQKRSKTTTPTFYSIPDTATELRSEHIQTRPRLNSQIPGSVIQDHEMQAKYTVPATLDSAPTSGVGQFPGYIDGFTPIAPTRRRTMQSMIDELNKDVDDPVLCGSPRLCLDSTPELFRSSMQPSVSDTTDDTHSANFGVPNSLKRRAGIASPQTQATVSMNGDPQPVAPGASGPSHHGRSAHDEMYQDLSAQTQPGSGRVKLVCFVWLLVFVLLGILEFL